MTALIGSSEVYGKVFASMYNGTLAGHWKAIVTFQQLIVLADADGIVDMTPAAISTRTSIPIEIITEGLEFLGKPDPYSRTPGEDGRRIVQIDEHRPWGWSIVNYQKYKHLKDSDEVRAQTRERVRRFRDKRNAEKRDVTQGNAEKRHIDTDTDTKRTTTAASAALDGFEILWKAYPKRAGNNPKRRAEKAYLSRLLEKHSPAEMIEGSARYAKYVRATGKDGTEFVLQAATFLGPDKPFLQPWTPPAPEAGKVTPLQAAKRICAYCPEPSVGSVNRYEHCREHESLAMDNVSPKARAA